MINKSCSKINIRGAKNKKVNEEDLMTSSTRNNGTKIGSSNTRSRIKKMVLILKSCLQQGGGSKEPQTRNNPRHKMTQTGITTTGNNKRRNPRREEKIHNSRARPERTHMGRISTVTARGIPEVTVTSNPARNPGTGEN